MSGLKSVLISLPSKRYNNNSPTMTTAAPQIFTTSAVVADKKLLKQLDTQNSPFTIFDSTARAKKRRLDHLSWEEKIQRKLV